MRLTVKMSRQMVLAVGLVADPAADLDRNIGTSQVLAETRGLYEVRCSWIDEVARR